MACFHSRWQLRVVGSGHSPSDIACTGEFMMKLSKFNRILGVEGDIVTFEGGTTLAQLNEVGALPCSMYSLRRQELSAHHGLALSSLGSISEQAFAGAIATGTHGTGVGFGCLASSVTFLRIISFNGEVLDS